MEIQFRKFGAVASTVCLLTGCACIAVATEALTIAVAAQIFQRPDLAQSFFRAWSIGLAIGIPCAVIGGCSLFLLTPAPGKLHEAI